MQRTSLFQVVHRFTVFRSFFVPKIKSDQSAECESGDEKEPKQRDVNSAPLEDSDEMDFPKSYPIFHTLLPYFKLQLKLCNFLNTVPFEWDCSKGKLRIVVSRRKYGICRAQIIIQCAYTFITVLNFILHGNDPAISTSSKMVGIALSVCFVAVSFMRIAFWIGRDGVVALVNNLLNFENMHYKNSAKDKGDRISNLLLLLALWTSGGLPFFMSAMLAVDACKPPHLGFFLYFSNGQCNIPSVIHRLIILSFDAMLWLNAIVPACFFGFHIFFLGLRCLHFYLSDLLLKMDSYVDLQSAKDQERCFRMYKQIQYLSNLYNNPLKGIFIPTQISAACIVIIIGLYSSIKLHKSIPMPGFAFFPLLIVDGLAMIFITQVGGGVFLMSTKFVRSSKKVSGRRKLLLSKVAQSLDVVKIHLGESSFIGERTPLILIDFCLIHTVSVVLLS